MYYGKEVRIMLKDQAKESFIELRKRNDKEAKSILNSLARIKEILRENPQFGDPIQKKLIPEEFARKGITNLYRVELSNYWRMIYTIEGSNVEILLFVLTITDHKDYNRLFGYG